VAALVSGLVELVAALTTPREPARELVDVVGRIAAIEARLPYLVRAYERRHAEVTLARLRARAGELRAFIEREG
jgi:hypothetical protein